MYSVTTRRWLLAGLLGVAVSWSSFAGAASAGDYTKTQAQAGAQVYNNTCAECHGSGLQGQSGPALAGSKFKDMLQYSKISAQQLFHFISSHMPKNDPGSLPHRQYLDVMAYILSQNGYPAGHVALTPSRLGQIKMLPYPGSSNSN